MMREPAAEGAVFRCSTLHFLSFQPNNREVSCCIYLAALAVADNLFMLNCFELSVMMGPLADYFSVNHCKFAAYFFQVQYFQDQCKWVFPDTMSNAMIEGLVGIETKEAFTSNARIKHGKWVVYLHESHKRLNTKHINATIVKKILCATHGIHLCFSGLWRE